MSASEYYAVAADQEMSGNLTPPPTPPTPRTKGGPTKMAANERKESLQNSINFKKEMDDIRKDLLLLTISISLLYLGLGSIEDIQRGLNDSRALNLTVRGLFIITKMASCVCLPSFLIHRLGCKLALIWAFCIHLIYLLASLDPRFSTLVVCSSAAGLMNPVLWTSLGIYVTKMAVVFSRQTAATPIPTPTEAVINKFFSIFFCLISTAFCVGSLVAATVLNPQVEGSIKSDEASFTCGAGYCNEPLKVVRECADLGDSFKGGQNALLAGATPGTSALTADKNGTGKIKLTLSSSTPPPTSSPTTSVTTSKRPTPSPTVIKIGINATIRVPTRGPPAQVPPPPVSDPVTSTPAVVTTTSPLPPPTKRVVLECSSNVFLPPSADSVYIVGGLYVAFGLAGLLIVIFLVRTLGSSPPPPLGDDDDEPLTRSIFSYIGSNFLLLKEYPVLLLLVLTTFGYGIVDYFFIYDYPKAYIVCISGHHYVGFLSFCVGLLAMMSAFAFIWVHVIFCRLWMTLASTGLACICILSLFFWKPHPDTKGVAFFLSMLWGIVNAIWNIQIYSIHGHLGYSKLESSFSNLIFWWSAGHLFGFIWSELVCIYFKLYIMVTFIFLASGAVVVLELILNAPHKKLTRVAPKPNQVTQARPEDILDQFKSKAAAAGSTGQEAAGVMRREAAGTTRREPATIASVAKRLDEDSTYKEMPAPSAPLEHSAVTLSAETPERETPLPPKHDTPLPLKYETPLPSNRDTPLPTNRDTPLPSNHDTPLPSNRDTPLPSNRDTPLPSNRDTPLPSNSDTSLPPKYDTPLPSSSDTPLPPKYDTPLPSKLETPVPPKQVTPLPPNNDTLPLPFSPSPPLSSTPNPDQ